MTGGNATGELEERVRQAWAHLKARELEEASAAKLYVEQVWPLLLELWRKEPRVEPYREQFDVSIHTLGFSPEATVLAILGLRPKEVHVLHTPDTRRHLEQIRRDAGCDIYPIEVGKSDVAEIYRTVERVVRRYPGKKIVVDVTSGTKAMTAGVGASAFFLQQRVHPELRVAYVDNDQWDSLLRKPVAGTERLILLPNPHEVLGDLGEHVARELYAAGRLGRAAALFRRLHGQTGLGVFQLYARLCDVYRQWYALDFQGARNSLRSLLNARDAWLRHELAACYRELEEQLAGLEAICQLSSPGGLSRPEGVLWLCATLLHLAHECKESDGQPVLAALYSYRAVELLLQHRLAVRGYNPDQPCLESSLVEAMRCNLARWLEKPVETVEVSCRLGLLEDMALLRALGDPAVGDMTDAEIRGYQAVLQARNKSLLIHGLESSNQGDVERLGRLASKLQEGVARQVGLHPRVAPVPLPPDASSRR